jgi:uncharacterized protein YfaP (DUF2135 family)
VSKTLKRSLPFAALAVLVVLMAGCSGGHGPTLPSPDGEVTPPPPPPSEQFCVNVEDADGEPIEGAWVYIGVESGYQEVERFETDADGRVCFDNLAARQYALTTAADGWATDHRIVEVTAVGGSVTVVLDDPVAVSPTQCPVVSMTAGDLNEAAGTAVVSGSVQHADSDSIVIFHNGEPTITALGQVAAAQNQVATSFSQLFFLTPGVNTFQVLVGNAACTVRYPSDPLQLNWTPPEGSDFVFRVTLSWNAATDADLHTWAPNLSDHSSYHNMAITSGQLDRDDTQGFGPENFTATQIEAGRWRVAINSYSLHDESRYDATVRVVTGGLAANSLSRTFGPHTFTTEDFETYPVQPPNWWRVVDIIVAADGTVSVAAPDGTALPAGVSAAAASPRK